MEKTLGELAIYLGGSLENAQPETLITGVCGLEEAGPEQISFAVPPYIEMAHLSHAGALILPLEGEVEGKAIIRVNNPRAAFAKLLAMYRPPEEIPQGISPYAYVDPTAVIGEGVAIMPFVYVGPEAVIGDEVVLYPHVYVGSKSQIGKESRIFPSVTVREQCIIGERCVVQAGAVIGGDGFGFITEDGKHTKVVQAGNVVLGDDVEVGCNTCIDRATSESTIVGKGTKVDNLVHLGHNDIIGENCLIIAQVGISGSTTIGDNCTLAGQTGVAGHLEIGKNCIFAAKSGIISSVPENSIFAGFPAQPHKSWLREEAALRKVGTLLKQVKALEKAVTALQQKKEE